MNVPFVSVFFIIPLIQDFLIIYRILVCIASVLANDQAPEPQFSFQPMNIPYGLYFEKISPLRLHTPLPLNLPTYSTTPKGFNTPFGWFARKTKMDLQARNTPAYRIPTTPTLLAIWSQLSPAAQRKYKKLSSLERKANIATTIESAFANNGLAIGFLDDDTTNVRITINTTSLKINFTSSVLLQRALNIVCDQFETKKQNKYQLISVSFIPHKELTM